MRPAVCPNQESPYSPSDHARPDEGVVGSVDGNGRCGRDLHGSLTRRKVLAGAVREVAWREDQCILAQLGDALAHISSREAGQIVDASELSLKGRKLPANAGEPNLIVWGHRDGDQAGDARVPLQGLRYRANDVISDRDTVSIGWKLQLIEKILCRRPYERSGPAEKACSGSG
jgi:hypothetical protein